MRPWRGPKPGTAPVWDALPEFGGTMRIIIDGRRCYVDGLPYHMNPQISLFGAHWDDDRRQWWCGRSRYDELRKLVDRLTTPVMVPTPGSRIAAEQLGLDPETPAGIVADFLGEEGREKEAERIRFGGYLQTPPSQVQLHGKVLWRGRMYYLASHKPTAEGKVKLVQHPRGDGTYFETWAPESDLLRIHSYPVRIDRTGRPLMMTLESMANFIEQQRQDRGTGRERVQCVECGSWHARGEECSQCPGS